MKPIVFLPQAKTEDYLKSRAKKAKKSEFKDILKRVPDREPLQGDEL